MFRSSAVLRNVAVMLQGNAIHAGVAFVSISIFAHLYTPSDFGNFKTTLAIMNVVFVAMSWRYEFPIFLARGATELRSLINLNIVLCGLMGIVTGVAITGCVFLIHIENRGIVDVLLFAPLWLMAAALMRTFINLALRDHKFGLSAAAKITHSVANGCAGIIYHYCGLAAGGLLLAETTARAASTALLIGKGYKSLASWRVSLAGMVLVARRYRDFPRIALPAVIINAIGVALPPTLIIIYFGAAVAGQVALVEGSLGAAVGLIGQSVGQVLTPTIAKSLRTGSDDLRIFRRTIAVQLCVGLCIAAVVEIAFSRLAILYFGSRWTMAAQFGPVLMPLYLCVFVAAPVNATLLLLENQRGQLFWDVCKAVSFFGVWHVAGTLHWTPLLAVAAYAAVGCCDYLLFLAIADVGIRRRMRRLAKARIVV